MKSEQLAIFNEDMVQIGTRSRAQVHTQGYWHQTFHCWFLQVQDSKRYLLFQRRAAQKKNFPDVLDITVAGHLLTREKPADGVREIQEELGIHIDVSELMAGGIIKDEYMARHYKNREFCHVYYYYLQQDISSLTLQKEEVASIVQLELADCLRLFRGQISTISGIEYQSLNDSQPLQPQEMLFSLQDFCPHNAHYYARVFYDAEQIANAKESRARELTQHTI